MSGYFQMFPPGWTVLEIPEVCPVCDKPVPRHFTFRWNGNGYEQLPMLNGRIVAPDVFHDVFCYGHTSVECSECGWIVPQGYHTEEECQRLGQICRKKKKKTEVPPAFYKAFETEGK
jgi:hypothetical protein